jgi:predicted metal-dependent HD superfamily phosphohydrolase
MTDEIVKKYWRLLEPRHGAGAFAILDAAYGQPQRGYHAWGHIADLMQKLDDRARFAARPDLIAAAIFWHDAVYLTRDADGRPRPDFDNVRDSAEAFRRFARFEAGDAAAVDEMIMATARHIEAAPSGERYPGFCGDFDLFLDLDLSSLAAPWPVFAENLEKIRFEFAWIPESAFSIGRLRMLQEFAADGSRLFRHPESVAQWDASARANLARCIGELQAKMEKLATRA